MAVVLITLHLQIRQRVRPSNSLMIRLNGLHALLFLLLYLLLKALASVHI